MSMVISFMVPISIGYLDKTRWLSVLIDLRKLVAQTGFAPASLALKGRNSRTAKLLGHLKLICKASLLLGTNCGSVKYYAIHIHWLNNAGRDPTGRFKP